MYSNWLIGFPGETVITGIGQGYTQVTPLQLAHAGAMLAANGRNFRPRLLIGTEDAVTREVSELDPVEAAHKMLRHIDRKRKALKLSPMMYEQAFKPEDGR